MAALSGVEHSARLGFNLPRCNPVAGPVPMTLVLTVVTLKRVVQVSDRLLTWPDGSMADDRANKAVCVSCDDGWFAISYSGAAQVGAKRTRTDEWLIDFLAAANAGSLRCADVIELIAQTAQS